MKTLYLERSTGECRNGDWVETLDLEGVERIVVGTGPGSFAGIRSAIAFAQGFALGSKCEVLGLPSACAVAAEVDASPLAVVGDARRGKFWIALFEGMKLVCPVFQVDQELLALRVPMGAKVVTPDAERIDAFLKETFGERYIGGVKPTEKGLRTFAEANPSALSPEPLPIYLNPAVRESQSSSAVSPGAS
jgi:tRNA threonylcarbamoyl adenosine modification protein YeaZ